MKIIHLSDLHIGKGKNTKRCKLLFEQLVKKYKTKQSRPIIIITGDIVDDGNKRWQYQKASELLDIIREYFEVLTVPGNHDYGWNCIFAREKNMKHYAKYICEDLCFPTVEHIEDCYFIGLDSMEDEHDGIDCLGAEGKIGKSQLCELNAVIEDINERAPESKIVVFLHHHPFYYKRLLRLKDADELKHVLQGRIQAFLFGHQHEPFEFVNKKEKFGMTLASQNSTDVDLGNKDDKLIFEYYQLDLEKDKVELVQLPL